MPRRGILRPWKPAFSIPEALPGLRDLYETSFPDEERIPWDDLLRLVAAMPLEFAVYEDAGCLLGMTVVYPRPLHTWFWYFAVPAPLRGAGIGRRILDLLITRHAESRPILDMEDPDQSDAPNPLQRRRRLAFYLRHGFRPTGVRRVFGPVAMTILAHGGAPFRDADYDTLLAELRRFWRPPGTPDPEERRFSEKRIDTSPRGG